MPERMSVHRYTSTICWLQGWYIRNYQIELRTEAPRGIILILRYWIIYPLSENV